MLKANNNNNDVGGVTKGIAVDRVSRRCRKREGPPKGVI